jgi:hypothetical protein
MPKYLCVGAYATSKGVSQARYALHGRPALALRAIRPVRCTSTCDDAIMDYGRAMAARECFSMLFPCRLFAFSQPRGCFLFSVVLGRKHPAGERQLREFRIMSNG